MCFYKNVYKKLNESILYANLATSVYFSKNWSRKDAQFFFNVQNYFEFKKGRNASKAKFHICFKLINHGLDYIERFFNICKKKNI